MKLNIVDFNNMEYEKALELQQKAQRLRIDDKINDTFILVEHPPVFTMGKRGQANNVLVSGHILEKENIQTVWINRGGDVTYHGPGQIVGYPIIHLAQNNIGIRVFVEKIQQTIIDFLKSEFSIEAEKKGGVHTGVWVGDKKICAIGISVSRNVTLHGFAFNINTNLEHFSYINPCGLGIGSVTSLKQLVGHEVDFEWAKQKVADSFCRIFDAKPTKTEIKDILGEI